MMHKAWRTIEEVPYCFVRSFIKFQGHTGWKIDDNLIWVRCRCQANTWTMTVMTSPVFFHWIILTHWGQTNHNKANLRDLIAATGLVISNWIQIIDFFSLEIWWMTSKNNRYFFYTMSSIVHHFNSIRWIWKLKLELQSGNAQFRLKLAIFCPVLPWNSMDDLGKH